MDDMIKEVKQDIETFIRSGTQSDHWPKRACVLIDDQLYRSVPGGNGVPGRHAEMIALDSIDELIEQTHEVVIYNNYSPCSECAREILQYAQTYSDIRFTFKFAFLYHPNQWAHHKGSVQLMNAPNITLEAMQGKDWKVVIQKILEYHGRRYWRTILDQIRQVPGREVLAQEILRCHGGDEWDIVLRQILKYESRQGWRMACSQILRHSAEREAELEVFLQGLRDPLIYSTTAKMVHTYQLHVWEQSSRILYYHSRDRMYNKLTQSLWNWGIENLSALASMMPHHHRKSYTWLKLVLSALGIEYRYIWPGRRMIADYVTLCTKEKMQHMR